MGFDGEFASYEPLRRILSSEKVKSLQDKLIINNSVDFDTNLAKYTFSKSNLPSNYSPNYIIAIDGGYHAAKIHNGFPGAEIGYIAISASLILNDEAELISKKAFINPKDFRKTEKASTLDTVIPGCNVIIKGEANTKSSMRKMLFEELASTRVFEDGETLLETYEYLLKLKLEDGFSKPAKSPIEGWEHTNMIYEHGKYTCPSSGQALYSTDALRLHELINPIGDNGGMYGQIMSMLEKLWLIHILRAFEQKKWFELLGKIVIILDGPLACFSAWSWMHKVIIKEINRINGAQKQQTHTDLLIFGIEKSGVFYNHFESIDTENSGILGKFKKQTGILLDDKYIKENIIYSDSKKPYGEGTYFGRKLFYKTKTNHRLVVNTAFLTKHHAVLATANSDQYPRLSDLINILDELTSSRYPNSITPLTVAHSEAAIPLNLGKRIFDEIAREIQNK